MTAKKLATTRKSSHSTPAAADADEHLAQALDLVGERVHARHRAQPAGHDRPTGTGALEAKNSGIMISWPMPMKRSRSFTAAASSIDMHGECGGSERQHRERADARP